MMSMLDIAMFHSEENYAKLNEDNFDFSCWQKHKSEVESRFGHAGRKTMMIFSAIKSLFKTFRYDLLSFIIPNFYVLAVIWFYYSAIYSAIM